MDKKYLAKIIATDNEGLQMISACCAGAKVRISEIKKQAVQKLIDTVDHSQVLDYL